MSEMKSAKKISIKSVILKGSLLFIMINLLFVPLAPLPVLGRITAYNFIFPGRIRLPYGELPDQAYNLSLYSLEAMFASHELSAPKPFDEYRVLLIGDSSVWGYLLKPENTLSAYINSADLKLKDGRIVRAYNLGYPTLSLTKDLLILNYGMHYQPDAIIWMVTLESFPREKQFESPIIQNNPSIIQNLISTYSLNLNPQDSRLSIPNYWDLTLIGERRALTDLLRLQLYGVMWAATGIDQYYPETYEPPQENLPRDETFHNLLPPILSPIDLSLDILLAGRKMAENVPMIYVNEPIYLSHGVNSDIRYNFFYPRWAYDQYRQLFAETCQTQNWRCLDEWNLVPPKEFTNSAIHMTPSGTQMLALEVEKVILSLPTP
jgi:hypothetical protein